MGRSERSKICPYRLVGLLFCQGSLTSHFKSRGAEQVDTFTLECGRFTRVRVRLAEWMTNQSQCLPRVLLFSLTSTSLPSPITRTVGSVGFAPSAQIGNGARARYRSDGSFPDNLDELRAALFFEQRRYHHFGEGPDGVDLDYIQALVGAIRRISGGAVPAPQIPCPEVVVSVTMVSGTQGGSLSWHGLIHPVDMISLSHPE